MTARATLDKLVTEKQFMVDVMHYARLKGWLLYHTHRSDRSEPGFPDLVLVRSPRIVFAELKTERGRPTEDQALWLDELGRSGGATVEAHLWRPSDWVQIEMVLA